MSEATTKNEAEHKVRRNLSRRRFLRGAGVCIALPTFSSLIPSRSKAAGDAPQRLLTLYHPNGTSQAPNDPTPPPNLLARMDAFRGRMSVLSNFTSHEFMLEHYNMLNHAHMACYLPHYFGQPLAAFGQETKTFDQYIADDPRHQGSARNSIAINVGMKTNAQNGVAPVYFNTSSWRGAGDAVPAFANPRALFEDLFGRANANSGEDEAARVALLERRQLFLDVVGDQVRTLQNELGRDDRFLLEEYLTSVAELDRRTAELATMRGEIVAACTPDDAPDGFSGESVRVPYDLYPETIDVMQDIVVRAFQCDLTRVATMSHCGVAGGGFVMRQPWVEGIEGPMNHWHPLSHWRSPYGNMPLDVNANQRDVERICAWHYDKWAQFLTKLQDTPGTEEASLLDETLVVAGSSMGYGSHSTKGVYQMMFGSACGAFNEGVDVNTGGDTDSGTANLWLTVLRGFGMDMPSYARSNGTIDQLLR